MLFYVFIGILMIVCGLIGFYNFIEDYERSLPHHKIEEYLSSQTGNGMDFVLKQSDFEVSEFETPAVLAGIIFSGEESPELSYKKSGKEYTEEAPVYLIQAEEKNVARVTLKKTGQTTSHGFPVWEIAGTEPLTGELKTQGVKIFVPEGTVPMVNGIAVPESYKTGSLTEIDDLKGAYKFLEGLPKLEEYHVSGLYKKPVITAEDGMGNALLAEARGDSYYFRPDNSAELRAAHEEMALALERAYISYMINENLETDVNFARLSPYLMPGSSAYSMLRNLSVEWNNAYDTREDKLISAERFTPYTADCFSCNTVFSIKLKRYSVENEYNGNIRWTFVRTEAGWKAVQMEFEG